MACNTCAKKFSLLRQEKGCPGCGFSYCSTCLKEKLFVQKLNAECKVCTNCKRSANSKSQKNIAPPDVYYKRIGAMSDNIPININTNLKDINSTDQQILSRLTKLKNESISSDDAITNRINKLKGELPSTSDAELAERLANIKGVPVTTFQSKPVSITPDLRTEQEQANDLIKQYVEEANINTTYKDEFDGLVNNIETRLQNLRGSSSSGITKNTDQKVSESFESEEETIKKIIEKAKREAILEKETETTCNDNDELPFCEICNEDANMRCLGCKYLFCKRCFIEHKDDDDGCNKYVPYTAPKSAI